MKIYLVDPTGLKCFTMEHISDKVLVCQGYVDQAPDSVTVLDYAQRSEPEWLNQLHSIKSEGFEEVRDHNHVFFTLEDANNKFSKKKQITKCKSLNPVSIQS